MSSRKKHRPFRTVTFRLTLGYALLFSILSVAAFGWAYMAIISGFNDQLDRNLKGDTVEFETLYMEKGLGALQKEFDRESESDGRNRVFMELISGDGRILAASDLEAWGSLPPRPTAVKDKQERIRFRTLTLPDREDPVRTVCKEIPGGKILRIGRTREENEILVRKLREIFGTTLTVLILLGGLGGGVAARRAMAGVSRVTETALRIGRGHLSRRVPPGNEGEEIEALASAFNAMLERIDSLVSGLEEVIHNIAHDLRSPLTRIRGIAETTLTGPDDPAAYREMAGTVVEECDRLVGLIQTLLEIAENDAGAAEIPMAGVDMAGLLKDAVELFEAPAEDRRIGLEANISGEPVLIDGDPRRLQRAVANLLDNAIKYTSPGGRINVSARREDGSVRIDITDTGIGIDPDKQSRIFDRFYRIAPARTTPGNGLGLSLARSVIRRHHGEISVTSTPGMGSTFTIRLPARKDHPENHDPV
ncbi:MAG: HAMP domain-containing histidine kinase [Deltaproteobacteria bacterium]|nr:HAMP domain-containing histidine kinase [Deltaproteobacteria bacterium]